MSEPQRVLVLCTGNSCRSQMAEGWINHELAGRWIARSAGTQPAARVHPLAIRAMAEVGIDISGGTPDSVDRFLEEPWDLVITVCDSAKETCPVFPGRGRKPAHLLSRPCRCLGHRRRGDGGLPRRPRRHPRTPGELRNDGLTCPPHATTVPTVIPTGERSPHSYCHPDRTNEAPHSYCHPDRTNEALTLTVIPTERGAPQRHRDPSLHLDPAATALAFDRNDGWEQSRLVQPSGRDPPLDRRGGM